MNLSKLGKLAWVFFALALTSTSVYSQGWRNGNRNYQNQNITCLNYISDLTEKQQKQILEMDEKHQQEMAELRIKHRSAFDAIEKNEIRGNMLKKVDAHRTSVKKVLNKNQQEQYDRLNTFGYYGRGQNFANRNDYENFNGRGRFGGGRGFARGIRGGQSFGYGNSSGRGYGRFCQVNNRGDYGNRGFRAGYGNASFSGNRGNFTRGYGNGYRGNFGRGYGNGYRNGNGRFYWQNNEAENGNNSKQSPEITEEK